MTTDIDVFFREGFLHVPGIFTPDEVTALREKTDACFASREHVDPKFISHVYGAFVLRRGAEYNPLFASLVERPEIQALASAALGPQPAFNALNVILERPHFAFSVASRRLASAHSDMKDHATSHPEQNPRHDVDFLAGF